jgi:hypothetical protein
MSAAAPAAATRAADPVGHRDCTVSARKDDRLVDFTSHFSISLIDAAEAEMR